MEQKKPFEAYLIISSNPHSVFHMIRDEDLTDKDMDSIQIGDQIMVNDWEDAATVKAVSTNYIYMECNKPDKDGEHEYSVMSKRRYDGPLHNRMIPGLYYCGPDNCVFGGPLSSLDRYLARFESGEIEISRRNGISIYDFYIKRK